MRAMDSEANGHEVREGDVGDLGGLVHACGPM